MWGIELDNSTIDTKLENYSTKETSFSKHDHYVNKLDDEIRSYYDKTLKNHVILSRSRRGKRLMTKGEIDLLCFRGDEIHIFEVKCSNRVTKARQQLKKIRKNIKSEFSDFSSIKTFFYCGSSDNLRLIPEA